MHKKSPWMERTNSKPDKKIDKSLEEKEVRTKNWVKVLRRNRKTEWNTKNDNKKE